MSEGPQKVQGDLDKAVAIETSRKKGKTYREKKKEE